MIETFKIIRDLWWGNSTKINT